MKRKLLVTFITTALVLMLCLMNINSIYAVKYDGVEIYGVSSSPFEFNPYELLEVYADSQVDTTKLKFVYDITGKNAIPVQVYDGTTVTENASWDDGKILADDGSNILGLRLAYGVGPENDTDAAKQEHQKERFDAWKDRVNEIKQSMIKVLKCTESDIEVVVTIKMPGIEKYNIKEESVILSSKDGISAAQWSIISKFDEYNKTINQAESNKSVVRTEQQLVSAKAITKDLAEYSLVLATDNNWYMIKTKDAPAPETPGEVKLETELNYNAKVDDKEVGGEKVNGTYIPNYDKDKVKKDADVTAIINEVNKVDIVKINGVDLKEDGTVNSLGWYYPDTKDKTVIAKVYPFEDYNNLKDNGMVTEKDLVLTGANGKTDTQTVSIKWPFRIIEVIKTPNEITKDTDKVTYTITTNLPIDKEKLPDGWNFTDNDKGKTQHQIYKEFFKKDGDKVETPVVTANGRTDTDKADVEVKWPKDDTPAENPFPQTGAFTIGLVAAIIGILGYAISRYRKLK